MFQLISNIVDKKQCQVHFIKICEIIIYGNKYLRMFYMFSFSFPNLVLEFKLFRIIYVYNYNIKIIIGISIRSFTL